MTTVIEAVNSATTDARERLALLMGALLEGGSLGSGPFPVGDTGTSFGPWQFHFVDATKLGLTPEQAADPAQSARAILPSYSAAVKRVPDSLWQSNPGQAAATAAYYAESPAYMYPAERISAAWNTITGAAKSTQPTDSNATPVDFPNPFNLISPGSGLADAFGAMPNPFNLISPGSGLADAFGAMGSAIAAPFQPIVDGFKKLADPSTWWRIMFVLGGAVLVFVGLGILNKNTVAELGGAVAKAA